MIPPLWTDTGSPLLSSLSRERDTRELALGCGQLEGKFAVAGETRRFGKGPHGGTADSPQTPVCSRSQLRWRNPQHLLCLPTKREAGGVCSLKAALSVRVSRGVTSSAGVLLWSFLLSNLPPFPPPPTLGSGGSGARAQTQALSGGDVCSPGFPGPDHAGFALRVPGL